MSRRRRPSAAADRHRQSADGLADLAAVLIVRGRTGLGYRTDDDLDALLQVVATLTEAREQRRTAGAVLAALDVSTAGQLAALLELVAGVTLNLVAGNGAAAITVDDVDLLLSFAGSRQIEAHQQALAAGTTLTELLTKGA